MRDLDNEYTLNPNANVMASENSYRKKKLKVIKKNQNGAPTITLVKQQPPPILRFMESTQNDPSEPFYEEFSTFDRADCKTVNMICIDNCDKTVKNN
jgi:hypothetical protein